MDHTWKGRSDKEVLYDEDTSDEVIRDVLDHTSARLSAALARKAEKIEDPKAREEIKERSIEVWQIQNNLGLSREQMVEKILRMRGELDEIKNEG